MRRPLSTGGDFGRVSGLLEGLDLHTVCRSAGCPNRRECWSAGTATFLILGGVCTRRCRFCGVPSGRPDAADPGEPGRVAEAAARMRLRHVVITCVTRDDLPDGGASAFAATVRALRERVAGATVEVLTSDFGGDGEALGLVLAAGPDVLAHNLETVRRLQAAARPGAGYGQSLAVLSRAAAFRPSVAVKSGLMFGLGETHAERLAALRDLRAAGCSLLTLGQYLCPDAARCLPVAEFLSPEAFDAYAAEARSMGFADVASGPMVRSSYRAGEMLRAARAAAAPREGQGVAAG